MLVVGLLPFLFSASALEDVGDALARRGAQAATSHVGGFRASVLLYHTASFSPVYALFCCFADPWLGELMYADSPRHYSFEPAAALGPGLLCLAGGFLTILWRLSRAGAR